MYKRQDAKEIADHAAKGGMLGISKESWMAALEKENYLKAAEMSICLLYTSLIIFVLAGAAGAAYYSIKFVKGRKRKDEDMDFFDDEGYEEEPYINEDEEPQIAEDAETDGDED